MNPNGNHENHDPPGAERRVREILGDGQTQKGAFSTGSPPGQSDTQNTQGVQRRRDGPGSGAL